MNFNQVLSINRLRASELVRSREFPQQRRHEICRQVFCQALRHPPIEVEFKTQEVDLALIIDHVQSGWTKLRAKGMHWSGPSTIDFQPNNIALNNRAVRTILLDDVVDSVDCATSKLVFQSRSDR